jgi:hypothetical protein
MRCEYCNAGAGSGVGDCTGAGVENFEGVGVGGFN